MCSYNGVQLGNDSNNSFNYVTPNSAVQKCFTDLPEAEKRRLERGHFNLNRAGITTVEPPLQAYICH